jgi:hypothetical protein
MTYDYYSFPLGGASRLPTTNEPILIISGHKGYWPAPTPDFDVDAYNRDLGVTPAQRMAKQIGSIFGFDAPGADPDCHLTTPTMTTKRTTTTLTPKRTKRTMAQIRTRAKARKMLNDPYYQELRSWHFGLGAKEAMETVKNFDALILAIETTKPANKRSYPSGIERVVRGYWVFGR